MTVISKKTKGIWLVLLLFFLELFRRALSRGASDFRVFYYAWQLVLRGRGELIYRDSPDRFLYSPGFAWLLAPLAWFSQDFAFMLWCLLKIVVVLWVAKWVSNQAFENSQYFKKSERSESVLLSISLGILLVVRPLIIDFEYGQVNVFILALAVWGLATHLDSKVSSWVAGWSWFLLGWISIAKVFPLPLLLIPFFVPVASSQEKLRAEQLAVLLAGLFNLMAPVVSLGWDRAWILFFDWRDALVARGFPLESHNQSFLALIHHFLSGQPTSILSENGRSILLGAAWLRPKQIVLVSCCWTLTTFGFVLAWVMRGPKENALKWVALLTGLLILPSHLIWKPYFVMSLPLAVIAVSQSVGPGSSLWRKSLLLLSFFGMNLTTFDFVGHKWGAVLEASSILLIFHLMLLIWIALDRPDRV